MWKHVGGGTRMIGGGRYPCDDEFMHTESGQFVTIRSTEAAHFDGIYALLRDMDWHLPDLGPVLALDGVEKAWSYSG